MQFDVNDPASIWNEWLRFHGLMKGHLNICQCHVEPTCQEELLFAGREVDRALCIWRSWTLWNVWGINNCTRATFHVASKVHCSGNLSVKRDGVLFRKRSFWRSLSKVTRHPQQNSCRILADCKGSVFSSPPLRKYRDLCKMARPNSPSFLNALSTRPDLAWVLPTVWDPNAVGRIQPWHRNRCKARERKDGQQLTLSIAHETKFHHVYVGMATREVHVREHDVLVSKRGFQVG